MNGDTPQEVVREPKVPEPAPRRALFYRLLHAIRLHKHTLIVGCIALLVLSVTVLLLLPQSPLNRHLFAGQRTSSQSVDSTSTSTSLGGSHTQGTNAPGLYQFVGSQNSNNATKSYLAGALLNFYWSQIEPSQGNYQWSVIDSAMQPWVAAGKHVILRISTSGNCYNDQAGSCDRTPAWVYAAGARAVHDSSGGTYPVFWDNAYQSAFSAFLRQYSARYDGNPNVAFIDAAVANDGETIISKNDRGQAYALWQPYGYTDKLWLSTITQIITLYGQSFTRTPIAVQPDATFVQPKGTSGALSESSLLQAVTNLDARYPNLMFQNDSLSPQQSLAGVWQQLPLAAEQGQAAGDTTTLQQELQAAEAEHARYILIFASDINQADNQTILEAASQAIAS